MLPLARIKRIIKSEGDVKAVSSEASFAVARAAVSIRLPFNLSVPNMLMICMYAITLAALQELLLEELARRANVQMQSQHRSTLQYKVVGESGS